MAKVEDLEVHARLAFTAGGSLIVEPENILQEADRLTSAAGKRPGDYGHPRDNLQLTADLWAPILGVEVTAEQVALCMIQLKIARECHKPGRDNLVDIAGWSRTIERLAE